MLWTKLFCISLLQTFANFVWDMQRLSFVSTKAWGTSRGNFRDWSHPADQREAEYLGSPKKGGSGMKGECQRWFVHCYMASMAWRFPDFHRFLMINDHISAFGGLCNFVPAVQQAARTIVAWWLVGFRGVLAKYNQDQVLWWSLVVRLDKPTITKSGERHFLASCTSKLIHSQWIRTFTLRLCLKIWDPKNHRNS